MRRAVIITDVTEMHGGQFCVAGWEARSARMIRPLPGIETNWAASRIGPESLWPGNTLEIDSTGQAPGSEFPHATEDTIIIPSSVAIRKRSAEWLAEVAASASETVNIAFGGMLKWRTYAGNRYHTVVPRGTNTKSLGAVVVRSDGIKFVVEDQKLRALVTDAEGTYKLPVVGHEVSKFYREQGVEALNRSFKKKGNLHIRVGLARAYTQYPDECFAMVNGVYPC